MELFASHAIKDSCHMLFRIVCFTFVGYLCFLQFQEFYANRDSSEVSYRRFNEDQQDLYPTYSICLSDTNYGSILHSNGTKISGTDVDTLGYINMLRGLRPTTKDANDIDFDSVVLDFCGNLLTKFYTKSKNKFGGGLMYSFTKSTLPFFQPPVYNCSFSPFIISYQDPNHLCFTKTNVYAKDEVKKHEEVYLDAEKMMNSLAELKFYIHQNGMLTSHLDDPILTLTSNEFERMTKVSSGIFAFRISQVEVLRKRPDAVKPCNASLENDDKSYREAVISKVDCVPEFWRRFATRLPLNEDASHPVPCTEQEQYQKISSFLPTTGNADKARKFYLQPCSQMNIVYSITQSDQVPNRRELIKHLILKIQFSPETYKQTKNYEAFTFTCLYSQVGGLVGMFLGYSVMQLPHLFKLGLESFKKIVNCNYVH